MTDNRRESLKSWLRMLRDLRRLPFRHPPFGGVDPDERWRNTQERWEIEAELDREDEAEAAKSRQQKSSAAPQSAPEAESTMVGRMIRVLTAHTPTAIVSESRDSKPKLRKATDEEVEEALLEVYEPLGEGNGPNVNEVVKPVQERLKTKGLKRSWDDIVDIAGREKFDKFRGRIGVRRLRNPQN
jgi:hypothetical protein